MAYNKDDCRAIFLLHKASLNDTIKNKAELNQILRESGRHPLTEIVTKHWRSDMKEISYTQFQNICRELPVMVRTELSRHLRKLDSRQLGYLDKNEFLNYLNQNCPEVSKKDIMEIVEKSDRNGDERLMFDEIASVLLSNLDPFRKLAHEKAESGDGPIPAKRRDLNRPVSSFSSNSRSMRDDYDDVDGPMDDMSLDSRRTDDLTDKLSLEKMIDAKFIFKEPRGYKNWKKTELRGGLYITETGAAANSVMNWNIKSTVYTINLSEASNVIIMMSPFTRITKLDLRNLPDMGFIVSNDKVKFTELSIPADSGGSVFFQGQLQAGTYRIYPFTTGAKLRQSEDNDDEVDFKSFQSSDRSASPSISSEFKSVLEDIFRMCDIDGNGFLSQEEFKIYAELTIEEGWDDEIWSELEDKYDLVNGEMSFKIFMKIIIDEYKEERYNPAFLVDIIESFGFNSKMELKEALPFIMSFNVESPVEYTARCPGLRNENMAMQDLLTNYVIRKGEELTNKSRITECNFYLHTSSGRVLMAIDNKNSPTNKNVVRLEIDLEKSKNLCFYNEKTLHKVALPSTSRKLVLAGVAEERKVAIFLNTVISKV